MPRCLAYASVISTTFCQLEYYNTCRLSFDNHIKHLKNVQQIVITYHVKIGESTEGSPEDGASLHSLDPHVVGEQHAEDGNALVIIGASHRSRDVTRYDGNHPCSNKPCPRSPKLLGEVVCDKGGEGGEEWGKKYTHIPNVNGNIEKVHDVVENS